MTNDELDAPVDAGIEREAMAEAPAAPAPVRAPSPAVARTTAKKPVARSKKAAAASTPGKAVKKSAKPTRAGAAASKKKAVGPSAGVVRLKFGAHEVWMARAIAGALSSKDKKKLKALLKRAGKRARKAD